MKNSFLLLFFILSLPPIGFSQNVIFDKVFPISGVSASKAISATTDGNLLICGSFRSGSNNDIIVIKSDINGDTLWTKFLRVNENEGGKDILQTFDGKIAVLGIKAPLAGEYRTSLWLLNTNGDSLWQKEYPEVAEALIQTRDSGFVMLGTADSNFHLIRTTSSGNTLWIKNYGSDNILSSMTDDRGFSLIEAPNGDILLAGYSINWHDKYAFVVRINEDGDTIWSKLFSVDLAPYLHMSITGSDTRGYVVVGSTYAPLGMKSQVLAFKIDDLGNLIWSKSYGGTEWDEGNSIIPVGNNGYAVTGVYDNEQTGLKDVYVLRLNQSGDTLWTKTIGALENKAGYDIAISDCHFFILGNYPDGTLNPSINLIKLSGACDTTTTFWQQDKKNEVSIYPNPPTGSLFVIGIPNNSGNVELQITTIEGRFIQSTMLSQESEIRLTSLSQGMYLCRILHNNRVIAVHRLIVL